jgi:hypothetical protein
MPVMVKSSEAQQNFDRMVDQALIEDDIITRMLMVIIDVLLLAFAFHQDTREAVKETWQRK